MRIWANSPLLCHLLKRPYSVDHYPAEDEKLRASSIIRRRGGNCPNTLEVFQQLLNSARFTSFSLALCSLLPSERSSAYSEIKASFDAATDLSLCLCRDNSHEAASSYIIRSNTAGTRTIVNYNGLQEMTSQEFGSLISEAREKISWCHFEVSHRSMI